MKRIADEFNDATRKSAKHAKNCARPPLLVAFGAVTLPSREDVLPIIQLAITPVILMSGIGAVLLSMTQRMGRIVDRTRSLAGLVRQEKDAGEREHLVSQLTIMFRRAKLLRFAMTMATTSVFVSGLLVVVIFVSALTRLELSAFILVLFVVSVSFLLLGLATFIRDVFLSLAALRREVERALKVPSVQDQP